MKTKTMTAVENTTAIAQAVTLPTREFTQELEWVARFTDKETTIPILGNVLMEFGRRTLTMTGTDLELGAVATMATRYTGKPFSVTVPASLALKYLKKVKDDATITITNAFKETTHVRATEKQPDLEPEVTRYYGLTISHGEDSEVSIDGMARDSYPELPVFKGERGVLEGIKTAIPRIAIAISKKESRFTLHGSLLICGADRVQWISTDGHRLAISESSANPKWEGRVLIPAQALTELARLSDSFEFGVDENHSFFYSENRQIVARKLTGNFPDYERVMPKNTTHSVTVEAAALARVIDRVSLFTDERSKATIFTLKDQKLIVEAHVSDKGKAKGAVAATWAEPNEFVIGLNCGYVTDFLKVIPPEVAFDVALRDYNAITVMTAEEGEKPKQTSCNEAITLQIPGFRYVVMPIKL